MFRFKIMGMILYPKLNTSDFVIVKLSEMKLRNIYISVIKYNLEIHTARLHSIRNVTIDSD